jgi:hypothetical protein
MENTNGSAVAVHKFEAAGLGVAPFKVSGFEVMKYQACHGAPIQPGTSCDYCGTGIMNVYFITGADGRRFKVGSDCVAKTGDAGLRKVVDTQERKLARAKRQAKATEQYQELKAMLADEPTRAKLASCPHPTPARAELGETLLTWAEWMVFYSGAAGRARTLKAVRAALK